MSDIEAQKKYAVAEFFSGIGSQAKALQNLELYGETSATCEWDVHAIIAYDLIHNPNVVPDDILNMNKKQLLESLKQYTFSNSGKEPLEYKSLKTYSLPTLQRLYLAIRRNHNFVDISKLSGEDMPDSIDILTYSFPCQDLSNVGALHGYKKGIDKNSGSRSSLLWQVGRILKEMKRTEKSLPRFLLMENVPTLLSKRHFPNFNIWISDLEKLGYLSKYYLLNASSFGLPQNRPRLLMISVLVGGDAERFELVQSYFKIKNDPDAVVNDYVKSKFYHGYTIQELLRTTYDDMQFFREACECTPNNTVSRQKIWNENPQIVKEGYVFNDTMNVIRTITTKQDRNPNSGNLYFDSGIEGKGKFRYLTPRECLLFMGFTDADYQVLKDNNLEFHKGDALFARDKVIRMAGNSIPVKLLEGMFYQIWQIDQFLSDFCRLHGIESDRRKQKEENIKRIKSFLFSKGIRCRKPTRNYPEDADLLYPKYNTAIFVWDCFNHGYQCKRATMPDINHSLWEEIFRLISDRNKSVCEKALKTGWHVIVVWDCAVEKQDKMDALLTAIQANAGHTKASDEVMEIV